MFDSRISYFNNSNKGVVAIYNTYIEHDNFIEGFTVKNNKSFLFDKEDFENVKNYLWKIKNKSNNVYTTINGKDVGFLKIIMNTNSSFKHINGNNSDNRRNNLSSKLGKNGNGKVYLNGYISVYMPDHPRAYDNGCVYEHILVAENILGRPLKDGECVHHKDKNRTNNSAENLMVFKSEIDHILFHAYGECVLNEDGSYSAKGRKILLPYTYNNRTASDIYNNIDDIGSVIIKDKTSKNKTRYYDLCPICKNNIMTKGSSMCINCFSEYKSRNIINDRNVLKQYIRTMPFTKVGEMFNVTDNTIRKWCDKYNLPRRTKDIKSYSDEEWELL